MTIARKQSRRRYYERNKAAELARCKVYRETKLAAKGRPVSCSVPGWGVKT